MHAWSFRVSLILRTLTSTTGSLCVRDSYACVYTGVGHTDIVSAQHFWLGKLTNLFVLRTGFEPQVNGIWYPTFYQWATPSLDTSSVSTPNMILENVPYFTFSRRYKKSKATHKADCLLPVDTKLNSVCHDLSSGVVYVVRLADRQDDTGDQGKGSKTDMPQRDRQHKRAMGRIFPLDSFGA